MAAGTAQSAAKRATDSERRGAELEVALARRRIQAYRAHRRLAAAVGLRFLPHPVQFMDRGETG